MDARDNSDYEGIIKNSLSPLAISFQNAVKEKRPNLKQEDGVLHGAVYFADEALRLVPKKELSLEQALEYIDTDELLEITPESLRIRKKILDPTLRKRANIRKQNS